MGKRYIFFFSILFFFQAVITTANLGSNFPSFQKGMQYCTWTKDGYAALHSEESLSKLKETGTEYVSILVTWYQDRYNTTSIYPTFKSPSDESLIHAIRKIHSLNMKVMLKPHVDLIELVDGKWRGEIEFYKDEDWIAWFKSYQDFILHYAKIAEDENIELFCIGTELTQPALQRPDLWRNLIKEVRKVYSGYLTYAANWHEEYFQIKFWDLLDYAGIDPYFPLIEKDRPTLEELKESWKPYLAVIEKWQKEIEKPVIFTEIGYKSSTGSADQPWLTMPGKEVDLQLQADCYTALLETFWDKPWFYGLYWWHWGTSPRMGGRLNKGYTPQNKPAQDIIKEWYKKPSPR